jgi:hypothetical protein
MNYNDSSKGENMYFYADGIDRNGNRLLTSYKKEDQAKRYRAGAKISSGEKFLKIGDNGEAKLSNEGDLLVRTLMIRPETADDEMNGNFVVYARIDKHWQPTSFRYSTYAKANAAVKTALINLYSACAIIETEGASTSAEKPTLNEEAPF